MHFATALSAVLLLVSSAAAVNKISCYVCNAATDPHCGDPIQTGEGGVKPQACSNDYINAAFDGFNAFSKGLSNIIGSDKAVQANFACLKVSYTLKAGDQEKKVVQRQCTLENSKFCDELTKNKKDNTDDFFCEECNTDECNGSSAIHAAAFVLVPAVALLLASH